jgi:uncharacterized repeat protein (TIGR04076 family)
MAKVKITVVKRMSNPDLITQYGKGIAEVCERFEDGQEWVLDRLNMPADFCSWAWADIQRDAAIMFSGGNLSWVDQPGVAISCCTDGFRPETSRGSTSRG